MENAMNIFTVIAYKNKNVILSLLKSYLLSSSLLVSWC